MSLGLVILVSTIAFLTSDFIGYRIVALVLLLTVSLTAMLFDILPVLLSALLSSIIWNYFFIPPLFTFHISNAEDTLMFIMYFIIALINAVLTLKIRKEEAKAREKEEKEKSIKLYNTLLNSLSHELRTPISNIIGAIDTLKENYSNITPNNRMELYEQIENSGTRLNEQVENLLNMSRLETGMLKLKMDWVDMNDLIQSVLNKFNQTKTHEIRFKQDENLPYLKIDRGIIEQVIYNILHNAISYTNAGTKIEITCKIVDANFYIYISDNGNGISDTHKQQIFDKFYRINNNKSGGTGIGLSVVKGFIEAHNGKISVEDTAGGGATFMISMPANTSYLNQLTNE